MAQVSVGVGRVGRGVDRGFPGEDLGGEDLREKVSGERISEERNKCSPPATGGKVGCSPSYFLG